ncbi:MAG: DUF2442 domain-containing protein [Oscillospiraceae bacterium]|nr:DUF2442 domain-containing protein [Oscillospiraceae bacterium]
MRDYPILTNVAPLDDYKLVLTFNDTEKRLYDFKPNLSHKFYACLSNINMFKAVSAVDGELEWASGQDFCPHTLYDNSELLQ